ncbi:MAG: ATP-binding cassette domain-containing protein [Chitinophagaceae bacterium]|nr:MAG: ATP-binding cassette domain-containing protein [Chitinophagaceae bacterium]
MHTPIVATQDLCYRYDKDSPALTDINLRIDKGSIYGFLGPNGSGKTTTLRLLLGLLPQQEGRITLFGEDLRHGRTRILRRVGALIENPSLYQQLTARENLEVFRELYGMPPARTGEVLELVDLADTGRKRAGRFSLGMKQRLALAIALLPRPELLVLDEPTNGLDPAGIVELRTLLQRLNREEGSTILVSSHILPEVARLVTDVGIIAHGQLRFQGPLSALYELQAGAASLEDLFIQLTAKNYEPAPLAAR